MGDVVPPISPSPLPLWAAQRGEKKGPVHPRMGWGKGTCVVKAVCRCPQKKKSKFLRMWGNSRKLKSSRNWVVLFILISSLFIPESFVYRKERMKEWNALPRLDISFFVVVFQKREEEAFHPHLVGNIEADPFAFPLHLRKKTILCSFGGAGRGRRCGTQKDGMWILFFSGKTTIFEPYFLKW